jgi:hypothetical protein
MTSGHWIVAAITAGLVIVCVLLHYEGLRILSDALPAPKALHRRRVVSIILCLMLIHIIEIWVFGGAYYLLMSYDGFGELMHANEMMLFDCIYYSASVFTTLGFGDITPLGPIRTMTGTEAVLGLTLITWSASYTFLEMLKTWSTDER